MVGRRSALIAGKTLNRMAEAIKKRSGNFALPIATEGELRDVENAVRIANEIIYQYYLIPKDVREFWYMEVGTDGVPVQNLAEE